MRDQEEEALRDVAAKLPSHVKPEGNLLCVCVDAESQDWI